jgi:WbqC-like protein
LAIELRATIPLKLEYSLNSMPNMLSTQDLKPELVAIMQPTFLPWAGWFDLADQVDLFIVLDDVPFSKQSWQQRNRIRTPQGLSYVTVPVRTAGKLGQRISDTELANIDVIDKLIRTVSQNYSRASYFDRYFADFSAVLRESASGGMLAGLNRGLIDWLLLQLKIPTPRVSSSELAVEGKRGALVAKLCERVGAARYVSPAGAQEYLIEDHAEFDQRGIAVELQNYAHPTYRQCFDPFMPYASVLDLLLNEGDAAAEILRSGRRPARKLEASNAG